MPVRVAGTWFHLEMRLEMRLGMGSISWLLKRST